jgi:hypothetical protein
LGATSWRYYTPYDPDAATALKRLRDDVFARGEFVDLTGSTEDQLRATMKRFGRDPDEATQVEARWSDVAETLRREHACFLVVFRDGQPDEYAFIGVSGD